MNQPKIIVSYQAEEFTRVQRFKTNKSKCCVAAVERLPALHYSVDFIFLSFGVMGFIVEL